MSSVRYCDRCEVGISKRDRLFHTRDRKILCASCHDAAVAEARSKAREHIAARASAGSGNRTRRVNLGIAAAIVIIVGGFILLMANQGEDATASEVQEAQALGNGANAPVAADR